MTATRIAPEMRQMRHGKSTDNRPIFLAESTDSTPEIVRNRQMTILNQQITMPRGAAHPVEFDGINQPAGLNSIGQAVGRREGGRMQNGGRTFLSAEGNHGGLENRPPDLEKILEKIGI